MFVCACECMCAHMHIDILYNSYLLDEQRSSVHSTLMERLWWGQEVEMTKPTLDPFDKASIVLLWTE